MTPFFCKISSEMTIMVIPDTQAHVDGHPVLTYSYTLYRTEPGHSEVELSSTDQLLAPEKVKHKDYFGTVYFEQPYKAFSYIADGRNELDAEDVEQVIDLITEYRMRQELWPEEF